MAVRTRTLAELQAEVRQRADVENDPHISDAELIRFINQSCAALHSMIVDAGSQFYTVQFSTTTDGSKGIASPANMYRLLKVSVQTGSMWRSLDRFDYDRYVDSLNAQALGGLPYPLGYFLGAGNYIFIAPPPTTVDPAIVWNVRAFTDMTAGSDTFDGQGGWEEWVVLDAAIKCLVKGEESIADMKNERTEVWARISTQFAIPDQDRPPVVRNTQSTTDDLGWWVP